MEERKKKGKQSLIEKDPIKGGEKKRSPTANRTVCPDCQVRAAAFPWSSSPHHLRSRF